MRSSVIIANYNKSQFLDALLSSIFDQIRPLNDDNQELQDEVIVIDDASTDNSVEIIKRFPCELIINSQNIGPAASRNLGVKKARGEILIFCDSDTLWEPNTLSRIINWFKDPKVVGVTGNLSNQPLRDNWSGHFYLMEEEENLNRSKIKTGQCGYWSSTLGALRSSIWQASGGFDESYKGADIEDLLLGAKLSKEHMLIFDKELIFHHDYSNLGIMLKKAVTRVSQITEVKSTFNNNPLIDNSFRKFGYVLSCTIFLGLLVRWSIPFLIMAKIIYHHYFFKRAFIRKGLIFCLYSLILMYGFSLCVLLGFLLGQTKRLKGMLKGA